MIAGRPAVGPIGIFGGTFDPIHIGHLAIAEAARDGLGLGLVVFVPTRLPVHKPGRLVSPAEDRVAMVALAIAANPDFALSRAEVDRSGPSYAVDTLEGFVTEVGRSGREPDLRFILSAEAYAGLPAWHRPERVLELARMAVVPRPGAPVVDLDAMDRLLPGARARTDLVDGPLLAISASAIRDRVATGRSIRYLVPDAVIAYIGDHGLYVASDPPE